MDQTAKSVLKNQIMTLSVANSATKSLLAMPVPTVVAGMPPMPLSLQPVLAPYLAAINTHIDNHEKLLKLLSDLIDKS